MPGGFAVPLGNIDGIGENEIGLVARSRSDNVSENNLTKSHLAGAVYFNGKIAATTLKPDLLIEPDSSQFLPYFIPIWFFGSLGKVDGGTTADFAIAGANSRDVCRLG